MVQNKTRMSGTATKGGPSTAWRTSTIPSPTTDPYPSNIQGSIEVKKPLKKRRLSGTRGVNNSGLVRRLTKEEEAFQPRELLDLCGSNSAHSRNLDPNERDLMLLRRRIRDRRSAASCYRKKKCTVKAVSDDLDWLLSRTEEVETQCQKVADEIARLRAANASLQWENNDLREQNAELKAGLKSNPLSLYPL